MKLPAIYRPVSVQASFLYAYKAGSRKDNEQIRKELERIGLTLLGPFDWQRACPGDFRSWPPIVGPGRGYVYIPPK